MRPAAKRPVARRAEDLPDGQHLLAHPRQLQAQQLRPGDAPGTKRDPTSRGSALDQCRTTAPAPFGSSAAPARSSGSAARRLIEPLGQPGRVTPRRDGQQRHEVVVVAQRARTVRRPASGSQAHGVGAQLAPARRTWVVRTTGVVGEALPTSRIGQNAQRLRWGGGPSGAHCGAVFFVVSAPNRVGRCIGSGRVFGLWPHTPALNGRWRVRDGPLC
jgi:hypothetical protein